MVMRNSVSECWNVPTRSECMQSVGYADVRRRIMTFDCNVTQVLDIGQREACRKRWNFIQLIQSSNQGVQWHGMPRKLCDPAPKTLRNLTIILMVGLINRTHGHVTHKMVTWVFLNMNFSPLNLITCYKVWSIYYNIDSTSMWITLR